MISTSEYDLVVDWHCCETLPVFMKKYYCFYCLGHRLSTTIRYSVGGYHRSLSRSKPGFESLYRNFLFLIIQTNSNSIHQHNRASICLDIGYDIFIFEFAGFILMHFSSVYKITFAFAIYCHC